MAKFTIEKVVKSLRSAFPHCEVSIDSSEAINKPGQSITVKPKDKNIGATLYWNQIKPQIEKEGNIQAVIDMVRKGIENVPASYNVEWIQDYEHIRNKLVICICSSETNNLENTPYHKVAGDLVEYYRILVDDFSDSGEATITVKDNLLKMWGKNAEQIREDALKSTQDIRPFVLHSIMDEFKEILGYTQEVDECPLWVATNVKKIYGAAVIAYPKFFDDVREKIGSNCYLLPSSTHEVLLAPATKMVQDVGFMAEMVREINKTEVAPEDRLSNNVFFVDINENTIKLAS